MCGRARCTLRPEDVPRAAHRHNLPARFLHLDRYRPSYNVAPGSYMPILRRDNDGDGVVVHSMQWGLVPSFTNKTDKPDFFKMFNARSESVDEKASFRRLLPKNRCLVAVDGFYEWKKEGSKKQPYFIHFKDGRPLVFAALFDSWQNAGGETLYTFTILTTASSSALQWLHDRMPVVLGDKDSVDKWLDDPSTSKLKPLLAPYENSDLAWYPVTSAIGKTTFDGPECIQKIQLKASQNNLISNFFSAKQPKTDKETKSTDANIPADVKKEPTVKGCKETVSSDNIIKTEELDEEKAIRNEVNNLETVKAEPLTEDYSVVSVKNKSEEGTDGEGKSIKTGLTRETDESSDIILAESSNLDLLKDLKEEPETQGHCFATGEELNQLELQHEALQDEPGNENQKTSSTCQTTKGSGLESNEKSSGKSGTKRDYDVFSAQEKPHSKKLQDAKSLGKPGRKQGKGKSNIKPKETQSTLHFFFDGK